MRLAFVPLSATVLSLSLFSCFDSPTGSGDSTGGGYYVRCTVDGAAKTFDQQITVQVMQLTDSSPVTMNIIGANGTLGVDTGSMISVFVPGTTVTTYNPGGPITISRLSPASVHSTFSEADSQVHSQVTLTRCDPPGGMVEGTFQGVAYDTLNDSMVITNGSFRVLRPVGSGTNGLTMLTNDTISVVYDGTTYVWRSKKPDGTPQDLVTCQTVSSGGQTITTITGAKNAAMPMIVITLRGPANGTYELGKKSGGEVIDGTLSLELSAIDVAEAIEDTCTDNQDVKHPFSAIVPLSVTTQAGRARGTFNGEVVGTSLVCPPAKKQLTSGALSIAVTVY
jgi:hypothetical protein